MDDMVGYTARFKRAYDKAVKAKKSRFEFDKQVVLSTFAKYYLEYLNTLLKKRESGV